MTLDKKTIEEIREYGTHVIDYASRADTVIELCDLALKGLERRPEAFTPTHPNGLWMVYYEEAGKPPEVFFGEGSEATARLRYKQAYDTWSCHLLSRVPDPRRNPEAELRDDGPDSP